MPTAPTKKTNGKVKIKVEKPKLGFFTHFASTASNWAGSPAAFAVAVGVIVIWALTGPIFDFSDTWQIVINTATTIITFLLVFLIQHSQNRDQRALHVKLDELLRATQGAHTTLINLEKLDEEELANIHGQYKALAERAQKAMDKGEDDTGIVDIALDKKKTA